MNRRDRENRKKKRERGLAALLCAVLALLAVGALALPAQRVQAKERRLKIVATIFPGYDFARQIAGDDADVQMLLRPGEEVHSYEPTPRDIRDIQEADLFLYTGGENDVWVEQILSSMGEDAPQTMRLVDLVDTRAEEIVEGMQEEKGEEEEEGEEEIDEHVWTSPVNAIEITRRIAREMEQLAPSHKKAFARNAAAYERKLQSLDEEFRKVVARGKRKTLVFGDRFPFRYFADAYGLSYFAPFTGCSEDAEPSAATLAYLIDKVREEKIPVVFKIEFSNGNIARAISEATGARVLTLQSAHNITAREFAAGVSYYDLMKRNVRALRRALS